MRPRSRRRRPGLSLGLGFPPGSSPWVDYRGYICFYICFCFVLLRACLGRAGRAGLPAADAAGRDALGSQIVRLAAGHLRLQKVMDHPAAVGGFDEAGLLQGGDIVVGAAEERLQRKVLDVAVGPAVDGVGDGEHPQERGLRMPGGERPHFDVEIELRGEFREGRHVLCHDGLLGRSGIGEGRDDARSARFVGYSSGPNGRPWLSSSAQSARLMPTRSALRGMPRMRSVSIRRVTCGSS